MSINTPTSIPFGLEATPIVGLEDVQRAAFYVFFEGLNTALDQVAAYWLPRDEEFDTRVGTTLAPIELEPIPNSNFHEGHKPSLVLSGPDAFPNIAIFATRADPGPENDRFDQIDQWSDSLLIEMMVKALDEDTVNRRVQRMAEAVVMCIRRNPTLGGAVTGITTAPSLNISDVFAVRSPGQGGAYQGQGNPGQTPGGRYIWQGATVQFRVPKDSVLPSDGSNTFATSSDVDYSQYIDQG